MLLHLRPERAIAITLSGLKYRDVMYRRALPNVIDLSLSGLNINKLKLRIEITIIFIELFRCSIIRVNYFLSCMKDACNFIKNSI